MKKAKTPEEEVEPLADPEPDIPPEITDPEDGEPDEKAARGDLPPPEGPFKPPDWPDWIQWGPSGTFDVSGPHHS